MSVFPLNLVPLLTTPWFAGGNEPAGNGNDFAQPPLNVEGSIPARMDSAQTPALPPFIEHAVNTDVNAPANEDIVVGGYHIAGVADIIGEESR